MILFLFAVGSAGAGIPDNVVSIIRSFHSCISAIAEQSSHWFSFFTLLLSLA